MTRLGALPSQAVISGFKGSIDFYLWKGIPCARKWPVWKLKERSPAVKAAGKDFANIMRLSTSIPPYVRIQYERMAQGTPLRWQDLLVRAYMSGIRY